MNSSRLIPKPKKPKPWRETKRKIESQAKEARRVVNILPLIVTLLCRLGLFCIISKGKNAAFS